MSSRTPPLADLTKQFQAASIQPIGGERKRAAPGRPGPSSNPAFGLWGGYNSSAGLPAGGMFHRGLPDAADDGHDYNLQAPYDPSGVATGDGDHGKMPNVSPSTSR